MRAGQLLGRATMKETEVLRNGTEGQREEAVREKASAGEYAAEARQDGAAGDDHDWGGVAEEA